MSMTTTWWSSFVHIQYMLIIHGDTLYLVQLESQNLATLADATSKERFDDLAVD
jgi:hypothetical protein